jgi:GAF domain-containing protein/HAMP domain-containing protein
MKKWLWFFSPTELLHRTKGWYPIVSLLVSQIITSPLGLLLAAVPSQVNAQLNTFQTTRLVIFAGILLLVRNLILLSTAYLVNQKMITRLKAVIIDPNSPVNENDEKTAWNQVTAFSWRYMVVALLSLYVFVLGPTLLYMFFSLGAELDQLIYVALAAGSAGLGLAVLELLLIESLMGPTQNLLLPKRFEFQIQRANPLRFLTKFLLIILVLVAVGILLVGPVGYHQTISALTSGLGPQVILNSLQTQLIIASVSALLLAFALAYALTLSISSPIKQMINTLEKVESGDFSQRLKVTTTDEVGDLSIYFNRMVSKLEDLQTNLESQIASRTEQLRATLEVGQVATSLLDPDEIIAKVVNLITERFGYYYAAIFLIDSRGRWAELKNATGTAGKTLLERGHKLELGGRSMVSTAISTRQNRIALDVGDEPIRFNNPLLPDTRSEIALPLLVRDRAIGALDVQSVKGAAFDQESINTLQGMANQLAIALDNALLFQETQQSLKELRATQRSYVKDSWSNLANESKVFEFGSGKSDISSDSNAVSLNVPLTLREQIIGELHLEGQEEWTAEEKGLVEAIATQATLAMENARLLEESQQVALRERLVAEITGKIWSSPNVEFILQTSIKELGRALQADEASIEMKME